MRCSYCTCLNILILIPASQISKEKEAVAIDQIKNTDGLTQVSHKNGYTISNGDLKHRKSAEHTNGHVIGNGVVNGIANGVANGHISNGIANGHVGGKLK